MNLLDLLRSDGSIVVNKRLAHEIGILEAVAFAEIASTFEYWRSRGRLVNEKLENTEDACWFFCTVEDLEKKTALTVSQQKRVINNLEKEGFIVRKKMGLPARRYFSLTNKIFQMVDNELPKNALGSNMENIAENEEKKPAKPRPYQFGENRPTGTAKIAQQESRKSPTNNTYINNTYLNKKELTSIVNKETPINDFQSLEKELKNIANEFYTEFSVGRYTKKQWNALINKFVSEAVQSERPIYNKRAYVYNALQNIINRRDSRLSAGEGSILGYNPYNE